MRTLATRETVFEAAGKILARGEDPSSRAIREEIGGGSLATIQRHLRVWHGEAHSGDRRRAGAAPRRPAAAPTLPPPNEDIRKLTEKVEWLEARIDELATDGNEAVDEDFAAVTAERDALKGRIARLSGQIEEMRMELVRMTTARDAAEAEAAVCRQILDLAAADRNRLMQSVARRLGDPASVGPRPLSPIIDRPR